MRQLLDNLNPPQKEACLYTHGPLLILAGAGSGKTRVLTYRIVYLVGEKKVPAEKILAVTFTNKAAQEMKKRAEDLLDISFHNLWISTFHSFCAKVLRKEALSANGEISSNFVIYDEEDQLSVIKKILQSMDLSNSSYPPGAVLDKISKAKNQLVSWENYPLYAHSIFEQKVAEIYKNYQKALQESQALDFDDLLMRAVEFFKSSPQVLEKYQKRFDYILVDEYQDTNHAQYELLKLLSEKHQNLCVVGDDDQSIYSWRGADLNNILNFEKDFPETKVIKLEQNYRSTQIILSAASEVVKNNLSRKGKALWTESEGGEKIKLLACGDEKQEAEIIAEKIKKLSGEVSLSEMVILYRTNAQSRILEQVLRDSGIRYTIVGGVRFYERKEIKDVLAYLKILSNPVDSVSWERVIKVFTSGVGKKSFDELGRFLQVRNVSMEEVFENLAEINLSLKVKNILEEFFTVFKEIKQLRDKISLAELTETIIKRSAYLDNLLVERTEEAQTRAENVEELINAVSEFCERNPDAKLENFLEEVALLTDIDRWDETSEKVTLMTLHSAKGLEFEVVFITGLEEGLFPLARACENQFELEEERRLFYVGMTRAKSKLFLTYAFRRKRFFASSGGEMQSLKSRFLEEIPEEFVEEELIGQKMPAWRSQKVAQKDFGFASGEDYLDTVLKIGSRVLHPSWGPGKVIDKQGWGENLKLVVVFNGNVKKKLMAKYANLEIIG